MRKPSDKEKSKRMMEERKVNRMAEIICKKTDFDTIREFFDQNAAPSYVIRNPYIPSSPYYYVKSYDDYEIEVPNLAETVMISVSVNGYRDHKVLLGSIEITHNNWVLLTATTNKDLDHRTMNGSAEFDFNVELDDKKTLNKVPLFNKLLDYLLQFGLTGYTVEFTIYDTPLGVLNDIIVISEIRSGY